MKRPCAWRLTILALLLIAGASVAASAAKSNDSGDLGDKVVAYCKDNLGKKVGTGQCASLASKALAAAGAKVRGGPDAPEKGDYVWGKQVYMLDASAGKPTETGDLADVKPGDVIQYRDAKFDHGHAAHHTSVVEDVDAKARTVKVLQQNVGGKQIVMEGSLKLSTMTTGWIRIYEPEAGK